MTDLSPFIVPTQARSWIDTEEISDFPIQNLPLGLARRIGGEAFAASRVGDFVLDLDSAASHSLVPSCARTLDGGLDLASIDFRQLRQALFDLLRDDGSKLRDSNWARDIVIPNQTVKMALPCKIGAFVDFYSGIRHAENVGRLFRPDMPPLLPNYRRLPVGYNGRASTVYVSETQIRRPWGQVKTDDSEDSIFSPTRELDFELELGFFCRRSNEGEPISADEAGDFIAGVVLVNDWSARDVQRWEYQPLGPFLAKSFATTISPWIVSLDALSSARCPGIEQAPPPLDYLKQDSPRAFDIDLEVTLRAARMSRGRVISRSNAANLYWSFGQQLAHQTSNGTRIEPGDLYATGTISGTDPNSYGSLLELTARGTKPLSLDSGVERGFLEDGDELSLGGYFTRSGVRIGLGAASGAILPARNR